MADWVFVAIGCVSVLALVGLMVMVKALTGRPQYTQTRHAEPARPGAHFAPFMLAAAAVVGVVLLTLISYRSGESVTQMAQMGRVSPVTEVPDYVVPIDAAAEPDSFAPGFDEDSDEPQSVSTDRADDSGTDTVSVAEKVLPEWTKRKRTILDNGEVPVVLFVASSGLYASEEEARADAIARATQDLRARLAETYPTLAKNPIPGDVFESKSIQESCTEVQMHQFGVYDEPMYRVHIQYMDSAHVREPIIDAWKRMVVGSRIKHYTIGFGLLAVLLGIASAGLRAVNATAGRHSRSVLAAVVAFVVSGATAFLLVG